MNKTALSNATTTVKPGMTSAARNPRITPSTQILITGCYAGTDPAEAGSLLEADRDSVIAPAAEDGSILINRLATRIDHWLDQFSDHLHRQSLRPAFGDCSENCKQSSTGTGSSALLPLPVIPPAKQAGRHVRPELRIQDGCDAHCTFCILPKIRPTLRSKRIGDVVDEAKRLVELGHKEIVLTGIRPSVARALVLRRPDRASNARPARPLASSNTCSAASPRAMP
jgi:tRNA A37 methylthiotransferase MiaB